METKIVKRENVKGLLTSSTIKNIVPVSDSHTLLLSVSKLNSTLTRKLGFTLFLDSTMKQKFSFVQSNVAIAAAITSYARIHMIPFKIDSQTIYSDTDSIFTTKKLPSSMIGKELGLMKDELSGGLIKEMYVLGIKQYGYWYLDSDGVRVEKSVWAGYTRNGLSFNDVESLAKGNSLQRPVNDRLFKSFNSLSLRIKPIVLNIKADPQRVLINNIYQPIYISKGKLGNPFYEYLNRLHQRVMVLFNKIFK